MIQLYKIKTAITGDIAKIILIFLIGYNLYTYQIDSVLIPYFDEQGYISAGLRLIEHTINENWSHPPLGKILIGLSTHHIGNYPLGWRLPSILSGSIILVAVYFMSKIFFKDRFSPIYSLVLTLINPLLFINSRIATLDAAMTAAIIIGLLMFSNYWLRNRSYKWLLLSYMSFGISASIKWFGFVPLILCTIILLTCSYKVRSKSLLYSTVLSFFIAMLFYLVAITSYIGMKHPIYAIPLSTSRPIVGSYLVKYSIQKLISLHVNMLTAQMSFKNIDSPITSNWHEWPIKLGVTWVLYPYNKLIGSSQVTKGVGIIPNPFLVLMGLMSVILCAYIWIKSKSKEAALLSAFYLGFLLSWAIIPRKTQYYYYYLPSSVILGLSVVYVFEFLRIKHLYRSTVILISVIFFIYSHPLMTNQELNEAEFRDRMRYLTKLNIIEAIYLETLQQR